MSTRNWSPPDLQGKVVLVAGATRGAGRAIAHALGEAGATVYCTGRSVPGSPGMAGRPETIQETARLVTEAGGRGVAVRVDHEDPKQVEALLERIRTEAGRLDALVNDVWGGNALAAWGKTFWEHDLDDGLRLLRRAIHTHIVTARFAAPLLLASKGTIVEITDGTNETNKAYRGNLYYDLAKVSVNRLALAFAQELAPHGGTAFAVTPGFLRSEEMLDHFGVTEETWRDAIAKDRFFAASETPAYVGRAVACALADPARAKRAGGAYSSWDLAREYGFPDRDGRRPDWDRDFARISAGEPIEP